MGARKARRIVRWDQSTLTATIEREYGGGTLDVPLSALSWVEVRHIASLVFPDVKGNLWISAGKDTLVSALRSGVVPDSVRQGVATVYVQGGNGPDNHEALCAAQDEIAKLRDELAAAQSATASTVVYSIENAPPSVKRRHHMFDQVYRLAALGLNVYLVGPAGTGKTTLAEQVAEALSLPFGTLSCHAQMTGTALFGYMDAQGRYVSTDYRRMATGDGSEQGPGLFLMDEIDNGNANITAALNTGLANGHVSFPDGIRPIDSRHVFMASANTFGTGATVKYIGRNALDAATLDRFVQVMVDYDTDLEREIAAQYGPKGVEWCERIHAYRQSAAEHGIDHVLSTRAIKDGAAMLAAGFTVDETLAMRVFRGLGADAVRKIRTADATLAARKREARAAAKQATEAQEARTDDSGSDDAEAADIGTVTVQTAQARATGYVRITSKYDSTCSECGEQITQGSIAYWRKRQAGQRHATILHSHCHTVRSEREGY